jgi:hypothetical protein
MAAARAQATWIELFGAAWAAEAVAAATTLAGLADFT